jgi:hypothetical protein
VCALGFCTDVAFFNVTVCGFATSLKNQLPLPLECVIHSFYPENGSNNFFRKVTAFILSHTFQLNGRIYSFKTDNRPVIITSMV